MKQQDLNEEIQRRYRRVKNKLRKEGLELWSITRTDSGPKSVFTKWYVTASLPESMDCVIGSEEKLSEAVKKVIEKAKKQEKEDE